MSDSLRALEILPHQLGPLLDIAAKQIAQLYHDVESDPVDCSAVPYSQQIPMSLPEVPLYVDTLVSAPEQVDASEAELVSRFRVLTEDLFRMARGHALNPVSPGFMGYVPGGGIFHAALADLMTDALNRYVGVTSVAPALAGIEHAVLGWFCEILGLPQGSGGFFTSGGSQANLSAVIVARERRLGADFREAVVYTSDQAHHCISKACRLAGFQASQLRIIQSDHLFRMDVDVLRRQIDADRDAGRRPFMVVGTAGTTNTGAVDDLESIAEVCRANALWFHVDAAYGGFFRLCERVKPVLAGIEQADSVVVDPHKTLFLPYGTGALLVRRQEDLKVTHHHAADYLPDPVEGDSPADFADLSPELTRPFRGFRVWLPFQMHGVGVFRNCLDEKLALAMWLAEAIEKRASLELVAAPQLSILAFALKSNGSHTTDVDQNKRTKQLLAAINRRNRVHLTGTLLRGRYVIRAAIVAFRTHSDRVQMLLDDLDAALDELG